MAYAKLTLAHPNIPGSVKVAPVGFSWTSLFFGFFVPFFRGDWLWGLIWLVIECFIWGFAMIIMAFAYNKMYINRLIKEGWRVKHATDDLNEISRKMGIALPTLGDFSTPTVSALDSPDEKETRV
jgi:hypothetical protein